MGTGIDRIYPTEHEQLADRILQAGALVSQFWPDAPPTKFSFPMRNVVMSGMAMGTVVIEAWATSGARMQARLALEQGKRLFLIESLVMQEEWAKRYAERAGTTVVDSVEDILDTLVAMARPVEQLTFRRTVAVPTAEEITDPHIGGSPSWVTASAWRTTSVPTSCQRARRQSWPMRREGSCSNPA